MIAERGGATGTLTIDAAPLALADGARLGTATLSWACRGTDAVEVRVGAPDGPLFCRGRARGSETTGAWVHDGMRFFLQDLSRLPAAPTPTIATAAARLDLRYRDVALREALAAIVWQHLQDVVRDIRLVPTHHDSVVCEIDCGTRSMFFKAFLSERDETVAVEGWAYDCLRRLGVPVPDLLHVDTSRTAIPASYILLAKVHGSLLSEHLSDPTDATPALLQDTGRWLRQIHNVDVTGYGPIEPHTFVQSGAIRGAHETWTDAVSRKFAEAARRVEAAGYLDADTLSAVRTAFGDRCSVLEGVDRCHALLHGDFDTGQVFVDAGTASVTGIFDFDDVASGDPAWDLAALAHRDGDEVLKRVLEGYEPDAGLTRRLPAFVALYSLVHDLVDLRVCRQRGWSERADRATARLRERAERSR